MNHSLLKINVNFYNSDKNYEDEPTLGYTAQNNKDVLSRIRYYYNKNIN
jgi:hypothetical protein